ncbi:MAG: PEP-CTERM sorting domain-containing protein, partial [Sphingomonas sp.]
VDLRLGRDDAGELYLLSKTRGEIFRIVGSVPEPATWAMLLLGFGMIGATIRRRAPGATVAA